jgi:hypothetical protein
MPAVPGLPMASPIRRPAGKDLPPVLAAYSLKRYRKPVGLSEKALAKLEQTIIGTREAKNPLKRQAVKKDPRVTEWLSGAALSTRASARRYLPTMTSLADMPMPDHVPKGHELATDCLRRMHALLKKKGITPVDLFRGNMIVPRQQQVTPFPSVPCARRSPVTIVCCIPLMHTAGDCKGGLPLYKFRPHALAPDREQGTRPHQPTYSC